MSAIIRPSLLPTRYLPCLPSVDAPQHAPVTVAADPDPLVARMRSTWSAGDYHQIALGIAAGGDAFVASLAPQRGERVLDVACGSGNLALAAARAGARVTGLDIAANLLATAGQRAADEGLSLVLDEGNAEALPYADGAFDLVVSMHGIMFTARPEVAGREALRVLRAGGRFAFASWTHDGFVARMLRAHVARVPAPAGVPSPLAWGDAARVPAYLGGARATCEVRTMDLAWPMPPAAVAQLFAQYYGPTVRTMAALSAQERGDFLDELTALWADANVARDGSTRVPDTYLAVTGRVG